MPRINQVTHINACAKLAILDSTITGIHLWN